MKRELTLGIVLLLSLTTVLAYDFSKSCESTGSCSCDGDLLCGSDAYCFSEDCGHTCPSVPHTYKVSDSCSSGRSGGCSCDGQFCTGLGCTPGTCIVSGIGSIFTGGCKCTVSGTCYYDCDSGWSDCDSGGGCETHTDADVNNCGSCDYKCIDEGCSGSKHSPYTEQNSEICQVIGCSEGSCNVKTKRTGYCDTSSNCVSGLSCQGGIGGEGWCCNPDECGHDGQCYSEYEDITINGQLYVCDRMDTGVMAWTEMTLKVSLGKMIQHERGVNKENLDSTAYFTDTGVSADCDNTEYESCQKGSPHYAYQYCSNVSSVFDGMFNLETNKKVPVLVSEQSLYDPYGGVTPTFGLEGCTGETKTSSERLKC